MKMTIQEQLTQVKLEMIEHFEEHGLDFDDIYLTEKDYFPVSANNLENDIEFTKWFYYFQGQYHVLLNILKFSKQNHV